LGRAEGWANAEARFMRAEKGARRWPRLSRDWYAEARFDEGERWDRCDAF